MPSATIEQFHSDLLDIGVEIIRGVMGTHASYSLLMLNWFRSKLNKTETRRLSFANLS